MELKDIKSPADIKGLSIKELEGVAADIRHALIQKLSIHGGHVGPNLGMVEATMALHYVFDAPKDKIVFDVSHQSYVHKMLTGRMQAFLEPEHYDDVTGFTNPRESEYDLFSIGHTSTAVSLATGLAKARDLRGGHENVVAVVGDGSLSGGEAYEGLNNAAVLHSNFIVVVNDNDMSIAPNRGGLYADLHLLRTTRGEAPVNFFRALGFAYRFVPYGNDLRSLIEAFQAVKDTTVPTVVHIVTEKGHGYEPAVKDKEKWHYEGPFNAATGEVYGQENAPDDYTDVTYKFLMKRLETDPSLVIVTSATPASFGFTEERRPQAGARFVDVGIAEEQAAAMSSGLARAGMSPFWGVVSTFVQRAYDQISQDICINSTPVVIGVFNGGVYGMNSVTHMGWFDIAMLSNIPTLVYLAPTCRKEYEAMLSWALTQKQYPVVVRALNGPATDLDIDVDTDYSALNTFSQVRNGSGVAIIAAGGMLAPALKAADILAAEGMNPTVINPRFLSGVDTEMLSALEPDHNAVITVEDGILDGGFGQKVAGFYGDRPMLVRTLGLKKEFMDGYSVKEVVRQAHLDAEGIASVARDMFK